MKPSICLTFKVHQPKQLRLYRFFDIGKDSHYYDDFANRSALKKTAAASYLPMNKMLLRLIEQTKGKLKVNFAISGTALEQMDRFCPELIDSFAELAATGCVEFICLPYYHSMAAVQDTDEFRHQVAKHRDAIKRYFGQDAVSFTNSDMVYTDSIGQTVSEMGFKTMITEGARHILGWRSPNFIYSNPFAPKLKLMLRNGSLSDDISIRFGERDWNNWPLTAEKYYGWLKQAAGEDVINLGMNYKVFGEYQRDYTGIFEFFESLVNIVLKDNVFQFSTVAEASKHKAVDTLVVEDPVSAEDEEHDMAKWLGNDLQKEAFNKLYALREKIALVNLPQLWEDFGHLQASDHFYNMNTKFFSDGGSHRYINPYDTPYEAFINYMNALSDFEIRVNEEQN